jgi:membrane-bound lytic murein transglycosylase A
MRTFVFSAPSARVAIAAGLIGMVVCNGPGNTQPAPAAQKIYVPVAFEALPRWSQDRHEKALQAFRLSCPAVLKSERSDTALRAVCEKALALPPAPPRATARRFFVDNFVPHRVQHDGAAGRVTGYFTPEHRGSLTRDPARGFTTPVWATPERNGVHVDLADPITAPNGQSVRAARRLADGRVVAYPTYEQADKGALDGEPVAVWLKSPVEAFMLQIEGAARITLPDGRAKTVNVSYNNGYPAIRWADVVREAQAKGDMPGSKPGERFSWMEANLSRARPWIWRNTLLHFFKVIDGDATHGARGNPLQNERSLAVDLACHAFGLPIYVSAPTLAHVPGADQFHRMMLAHDAGSAIKGPERGDIFFGTGAAAGEIASRTSAAATFHVLLPKGFVDRPDPVRPCRRT